MLRMSESMLGRLRPDDYAGAAIVLAFVAAGLLIGLVVANGQPIPIALTLGLIAGIALLNAIPFVIWIVVTGVLLISGPLFMHVPAIDKAGWLFSLLGFFLSGAAILYPAVSRSRFARPVPPFVTMAALLFAFGLLSLLYSGGPLGEGVRAASMINVRSPSCEKTTPRFATTKLLPSPRSTLVIARAVCPGVPSNQRIISWLRSPRSASANGASGFSAEVNPPGAE